MKPPFVLVAAAIITLSAFARADSTPPSKVYPHEQALSPKVPVLKLKSGVVLYDAELLKIEDDYLTFRHSKGASQIKVSDLPEIPGFNDPATIKRRRSEALALESIYKVRVSRSDAKDRHGRSLELTFNSDHDIEYLLTMYRGTATDGHFDIVSLSPADYQATYALFTKFIAWDSQCQKDNIPTVDRELGKIGDDALKFERSSGMSLLHFRKALFFSDDVEAFVKLMSNGQDLVKEFQDEIEKAKKAGQLD